MKTNTVHSGDVEISMLEAGETDRPTLVFIHGYPDSKEMWQPVMERLEDRFHVVAYDVRGAGWSSAPRRVAEYDLDRLGDDLLAVADAMAPGRRVHLVGHDWGGIQGWEFVTQPRFERRVASLTTIAGPSLDQVAAGGNALWRERRPLAALARARRSWYILVLLTPGGPTLMWRYLLGGDRWRAALGRAQGAATIARDGLNGANLYRRNIPRRLLHPRLAAAAHAPVQLIIPSRDRYIPEDYYAEAERHAPGLRRRSIDSSHWAPQEQPDVVAEWIGEFVDEVEGH